MNRINYFKRYRNSNFKTLIEQTCKQFYKKKNCSQTATSPVILQLLWTVTAAGRV